MWLNTKPDKSEITRLQKMRADGIEPELPYIEAAYLVEYLNEIGPVMPDGPLTFGEVESWQRQTGIDLQPWEVRMLRRLSIEYGNESIRAKSPNCKPPYGGLSRNPALDTKLDAFLD